MPRDEQTARLRRMKAAALLALLGAGGVFVVTTALPGLGTVGRYAQAGSEAAMVGGLADWFAVTALFRRPLGLPIPHTALVPRKKDELATKLGEFVTGYFLTPDALAAQIGESAVVERAGLWVAEPERAASLASSVASALGAAVGALDADSTAGHLLDLVRRPRARRSLAPALGRILAGAVDAGAPQPLTALVASRARRYLETNRARLHPVVKRFVEDRHWIAALVTTDRTIDRLLVDAAGELGRIERSPDHPVHVAIDDVLRTIASDLLHDPVVRDHVEAAAATLLEDPRTADAVRDVVLDAAAALREALADPAGGLGPRIASVISDLGRRAAADADFHAALEGWVERAAGYVVDRHGHELTRLIRRQVEAWPAQAAARRIELAVGRDLQFIRINGTVVGAAAGLVIHAVAVAIR